MVANYITLTPGTLTVDVSPDRRTLLVHSLLAGDSSDGVRADIRDGIEPRVLQGDARMIIETVAERGLRRRAGARRRSA